MKQSLFKLGIALLGACALLAPIPTRAQPIHFKITGLFVQLLAPDILCVSDRGQVSLKGNVHVVKMVSDEPRAAGRGRAVNLDVALNPDGSGTFSGRAWMEVGTWDAANNFTRTDGVWEMKYTGLIHTDGSTEYKFSGSGIGGIIDGLHMNATATRASSSLNVPYLFSGMITAVGHD